MLSGMCTYIIIPVLGAFRNSIGQHHRAVLLWVHAIILQPPTFIPVLLFFLLHRSFCAPGPFSSQIPALALAFALDRTLQSSFLALFLGLARIYFLQGKAFSLSFHVINSGSGCIEETDKRGYGWSTIITSCGRLSQEVHEFVLAWAVY